MTSNAPKISNMQRVSFIAVSCLRTIAVAQTASPVPPVAPVVDHRESHHGVTIVDSYFWLREKSNPETIKYLEAENAYTDAMTRELKPFEDSLYKEMLGRIKQTDLSVPTRRGATFTIRGLRKESSIPSSAGKRVRMAPRRFCST